METQAPRTTHWLYSKSGGCRAGDGSGWYTPAIEAVKSSHINSVGAGCPGGTLTLPVTCTPFSSLMSRTCGARTSPKIGRASGRERVCQYGVISDGAVTIKTKNITKNKKIE